MHRLCWFRRTAVFVALLAFFVSPAAAISWGGIAPVGPLAGIGSWLTAVWAEAGCIIDPGGKCRAAAEQVDAGCGIDPNGVTCPGNQ